MHLLVRRSQRDDGWVWTSMMFLLDARLDLLREEALLFETYQLRSLVVYDSDARVQHAYSAHEHFEAAARPMRPIPWDPSFADLATAFGEIATALWSDAAATTQVIMSLLSLRITLGSLIDGQHFESADLEEMLTVENAIRQAVEYLAAYLDIALTFDGSEELSEH